MERTNQHYVPQFLLRGFSIEGTNNRQICAFDKLTGKSFKPAIRQMVSRLGFYDYEHNGSTSSLDPDLKEIETASAPIINELVQTKSIAALSKEQRVGVAVFTAVQLLRTDSRRLQYKHLVTSLKEAIKERGGNPDEMDVFRSQTDEELSEESIRTIPPLVDSLVPHILNKTWILYGTTSDDPFYISDNPVTKQNNVNKSSYLGTVGLAVPGIEIHLPISSILSLAFLCPSLEEMIREREQWPVARDTLEFWRRAFEGIAPLPLEHENVAYLNSLQVLYAERYLFSGKEDFRLAREMVSSNPHMSAGLRMRMA